MACFRFAQSDLLRVRRLGFSFCRFVLLPTKLHRGVACFCSAFFRPVHAVSDEPRSVRAVGDRQRRGKAESIIHQSIIACLLPHRYLKHRQVDNICS